MQYNVANAGSAPFPINIYSSTDGTTPDQLLTSYTVGGANGNDLTVGDHTALIAPPAGTPSGDYYLIASADSGAATSNNNTLALSGGTSFNAPQIIDTGNLGYADSGNGTLLSAGFTNTEQLLPANTGNATWQFTNLPTATYSYYDVYVTWSPQSNDNVLPGAALYTVSDVNGTQLNPIGQGSIAAVDQTIAPADDQANGTFWQHLGVFQVATGTTLQVQLTGNASPVLADAVRLVPHNTAPAGNMNLSAGVFSVSRPGTDVRHLHRHRQQQQQRHVLQHRHLRLARPRDAGQLAPDVSGDRSIHAHPRPTHCAVRRRP